MDIEIIYLVYVSRNHECVECGGQARLHDKGERLVADVDCNRPVFVHVTMGVQWCTQRYFGGCKTGGSGKGIEMESHTMHDYRGYCHQE